MIPFVTFRPKRLVVTEARVPSDFAIASSITSIACAPYCEYGFGVAPICVAEVRDERLALALQARRRLARDADVRVVERGRRSTSDR